MGREGSGWGSRIAEPVSRTLSVLTTGTETLGPRSGHVGAQTSAPACSRNGTISSEADFVENHSGKMDLTLFFPSLISSFSFSSKRHFSIADKLKFDSEIN